MGNSVNGDHTLRSDEINVFFDCSGGGHLWTYSNGDDIFCSICSAWSFSSTDFSGGPRQAFNQLQWDYDLATGYQIGADEVNIKIDTITRASSKDEWYITTTLDAIYTYNTFHYENRSCTLRHSTGKTSIYNKWTSQSSTTTVSGREAMMDCSNDAQPLYIQILC